MPKELVDGSMLKTTLIAVTLFVLSIDGMAQIFLPERGDYRYDISDIDFAFKSTGQGHLLLRREFTIPGAKYKLRSSRNDFQIKDWYLRDWYTMQDMYGLDFDGYLRSMDAKTFNEAKRRQYSAFTFKKKKNFHLKTVPTLREWGGLTHPPVKKITRPLQDYDSSFGPIDYASIKSPYFDPGLQKEIDVLSRSELTFGNEVKALADREAWIGKKQLIKKARQSILMSSLVYICDKSTRELVDLLIQKHNEGVKVRVITDGFISKLLKHRECPKLMRDAGIEVIETKDFFRYKLKAIYHTKTLVVDNSEAIAGGHNMIDADNTSRGTDFKNRDIDLYMKGPMVSDVTKQFIENWQHHLAMYGNNKGRLTTMLREQLAITSKLFEERRMGLRGQSHYQKVLSSPVTRMKGVCRFIKQAPYEDRHTVGKAYLKLLGLVRKHLVITDPVKTDTYAKNRRSLPLIDKFDNFEMFNKLQVKVQEMARSGKKIDYLTTSMDMAGNENVAIYNDRIRDQLQRGKRFWANWGLVKIFLSNKYYGGDHYKHLIQDYLPHKSVHVWTHISFLHSKIFYFDRVVSSVGSVNFQHNATDQAYESTSICMDEKLNRELDEILVMDMANSIPLVFSTLTK